MNTSLRLVVFLSAWVGMSAHAAVGAQAGYGVREDTGEKAGYLRFWLGGGPITITCNACHAAEAPRQGIKPTATWAGKEYTRHTTQIFPKVAFKLDEGKSVPLNDMTLLRERGNIVVLDAQKKRQLVLPPNTMILKDYEGKPAIFYAPDATEVVVR